MTIDDTVKEEKVPSWQDLFSMSYEELARLSGEHKAVIASGQREALLKIARLHAKDILPQAMTSDADWPQVLQYIQHMLEQGEINPLVADEIHTTNGSAPSFQRLKTDKATSKTYNDEGLLIESARFYPSGTVLRTIHSLFKDEQAWQIATRGQEFYHSLVGFVKEKFDAKNTLGDGEKYIAERIARAAPIRPLNSENNVLDNVFVNGRDLQEEFEQNNPSIDERVRMLSEVTDIDLITSFYSKEFMSIQKGKDASTTGKIFKKQLFKPKDGRLDFFEDILLRADKELRRELTDAVVITPSGRFLGEHDFTLFYLEARDKPEIKNLIMLVGGFGDDVVNQRYFTPYDLNLGNVMISERDGQRRYTHIDFERSRLDTLSSLLFKRWAQAGVYDNDGLSKSLANDRSAELELLENAYVTLKTLCEVNGTHALSFDDFRSNFHSHKKMHLLRLARRYKEFEEGKKGDVEVLRAHKRFFYTMFVNVVVGEGKTSGKDSPALDYLSTLFEQPLSHEEMMRVGEKYNPCFCTNEELNPFSVGDVASKNRELIDRYNAAKRKRKVKRLAVGLAIPTLLAAVVGTAVALGVKSNEADDLGDKVKDLDYVRAERTRQWGLSERSGTLSMLTGVARNEGTLLGKYLLEELRDEFGDENTARAAFIDFNAVYEAVQENGGRTDWAVIEPYITKNYYDVFSALYDSEGHIDNVFLSATTDQNRESARRWLHDLREEAKFRYQMGKSGQWRDCIFQGYGLSGVYSGSDGEHTWSWSYECVPDPDEPGSKGQEPTTVSDDKMPDFWAAHDYRR